MNGSGHSKRCNHSTIQIYILPAVVTKSLHSVASEALCRVSLSQWHKASKYPLRPLQLRAKLNMELDQELKDTTMTYTSTTHAQIWILEFIAARKWGLDTYNEEVVAGTQA